MLFFIGAIFLIVTFIPTIRILFCLFVIDLFILLGYEY